MPPPAEILEALTDIANEWWQIAALWHAAMLMLLAGLAVRIPLSQRSAATGAAMPVATAALAAWGFGNPFNGIILTAFAVTLFILARRLPNEPVSRGPLWTLIIGIILAAFGWVYPHFLIDKPAWVYLVAAPVGLVPCATLSVVVGWGLIGNSLRSRSWGTTVAAAGLFYGAFGAFRLGVQIDLILLVGSIALLIAALRLPKPSSS